MKKTCDDPSATAKPSARAVAICFVAAFCLGLVGLLMTLYMLLANMNIRFSSTPQLGMFLAGWAFIGVAVLSVCRLLRRPGYQSVWYLVLPAICMAIVRWLGTFPENQHLMH